MIRPLTVVSLVTRVSLVSLVSLLSLVAPSARASERAVADGRPGAAGPSMAVLQGRAGSGAGLVWSASREAAGPGMNAEGAARWHLERHRGALGLSRAMHQTTVKN